MKKAKLFMMLALLVMGVSNVWSATQHFNVVYSGRTVDQGAGYTADSNNITYTQQGYGGGTRVAGTIQNVTATGFDVIGDYATETNWQGNLRYINEISSHITPTHVDGYAATVSASGTTVTITYTEAVLKYRVIFDASLLPGAGYSIINRNMSNGTITSADNADVLIIQGNGESMPTGFTGGYDYESGTYTNSNVVNYISANTDGINGYTTSVRFYPNEAQMGYAGNIYIEYFTTATETKTDDENWYYSNVYERDSHTKILLPSKECAISLKNTNLVNAEIPSKAPNGDVVVAIQKYGLCYPANPVMSISSYNCSEDYLNRNYRDYPNNRASTYFDENHTTQTKATTYDHKNEVLKTVTFASGSQVKSIGDYAFICCTALETVEDIPSTLEYMGQGVFGYNISLTKVDFPSVASVKTIRNITFWKCFSLTRLYLPEGIEEIEGQQSGAAMQYMTSLEELHLPNTLKRVGPHFLCCATSLKSLTIPISVVYIDGACFHGCESLEKVYILGPAATLQNANGNSNTFDQNVTYCADPVNNCTFYTTSENLAGYQNDPVWSKINNNGKWQEAASGGFTKGYANYLMAIPEEERTMPTKWVTAVFPKEVAKSTFGEGTLVAEMNNCDGYTTQNIDGKVYRVYHLNFTEIEGDYIPANLPLLIKAGQETDYVFYNAADQEEDWFKQHSTDPLTVPVICYQDGAEITMKGVYLEHNIQPGEFYFKNNNDDFTTDEDGKTVEHPKFLIAPETGYVTIDPCRCWWTIEQDKHIPGNSTIAPAKSSRFFGETTGIEEIETRIVIDAIYDLNGHKLEVKQEDLPQGLFIINGKKVVKK